MTENPNQTAQLLDPSINIDDLTPEQIQQRILQFLGVPPPRPKTYMVLIALDVPQTDAKVKNADGSDSLLYIPEAIKEKYSYSSCTGMVVALGPDAYQDKNRFPSGPACKLGEWVTIPRHEGVQIRYRGKIMHWLPDDKVALGIDDPSYVVRG